MSGGGQICIGQCNGEANGNLPKGPDAKEAWGPDAIHATILRGEPVGDQPLIFVVLTRVLDKDDVHWAAVRAEAKGLSLEREADAPPMPPPRELPPIRFVQEGGSSSSTA